MRWLEFFLIVLLILACFGLLYENYQKSKLEYELHKSRINYSFLMLDSENKTRYIHQLQRELRQLREENSKLKEQISKLRSNIESLKQQIDTLKYEIHLFEKVPKNYYDHFFPKYPNTYEGLLDFLHHLVCPKPAFKRCTFVAAFTEWALENAGFNASIVVSAWYENGHPVGSHAFDMVVIGKKKYYVDLAATRTPILYTKLKDKYHKHICDVYRNIYQAIDGLWYKCLDWWDYTGFPPPKNECWRKYVPVHINWY